jgi:multidrug efflux system membrane fusion protein
VDVGNYLAVGDANGVAVITVMDPIDVEFAVPQDQIGALQKHLTEYGTRLSAVALDRSRTTKLAEGFFSTIDNRVDTTTGTVKAKARFPNKGGVLFPSQFVNVRVQLDVLKDAVVVPSGAVRRGADGDFVYAVNRADSTVAMRNVKSGITDNDRTVILDGLKVGEEVVTEGGDRLRDGAKVQLPDAQPPGGGPPGKSKRDGAKGQRPMPAA